MNLQERAMPNAFAGKRDFALETKAPEPLTNPIAALQRRRVHEKRRRIGPICGSFPPPTCRRCNLQSECLPETFFVSA